MSFKDMKDMFGQLRDAQKQMKTIQKQLSTIKVAAETGGGMVKATVDGEANLIDLEIDSSLLNHDEIKVLPKLIKKAVQEAQSKAKKQVMEQMKGLAGGMGMGF